MKAIIKRTGEVIEVNQVCPEQWAEITSDAIGRRVFQRDALILDEPTDWASFRREAAKEILAGLVVQKNWRYHPDEYDKDEEEAQKRAAKRAAYTAIVYADELIKQLRGE